jgi:hypothetical protein
VSQLGELQEKFAVLEAEWVLWVTSHPGWKLRHGEGRILVLGADGKGRPALDLKTGNVIRVKDLVHLASGSHPKGLAGDWQLFVDGVYITQSDHPIWIECGTNWESRDPLCRWGGRWNDGNHISVEHGGVK